MFKLLDGEETAKHVKEELRKEIKQFKTVCNVIPGLGIVLVGDEPASKIYVDLKLKDCKELGMYGELRKLPETSSHENVVETVHELNSKDDIHGMIVQLPLPEHIDEDAIIGHIDPKKDVDGLTPYNMGRLSLGLDCYEPATPQGIMTLLHRYNISVAGKHAVIVGRSRIVGSPLAIMLSRKGVDATVTKCHSKTDPLKYFTTQADILVCAIGSPYCITEDMVKEGAVIIDVGTSRVDDPTKKRGYRWVGDVDYDSVKDKVYAITPVPGGVGPMTRVGLMVNTTKAARMQYEK